MASKSQAPKPIVESEIVEIQVFLNSRGRSVVNGTLLVDGQMRTVKHELSFSSREEIGKSILHALSERSLV